MSSSRARQTEPLGASDGARAGPSSLARRGPTLLALRSMEGPSAFLTSTDALGEGAAGEWVAGLGGEAGGAKEGFGEAAGRPLREGVLLGVSILDLVGLSGLASLSASAIEVSTSPGERTWLGFGDALPLFTALPGRDGFAPFGVPAGEGTLTPLRRKTGTF